MWECGEQWHPIPIWILEVMYFIKPQNPKPYQALAHNKENCIYIKGLMGNMGSVDI
jgi:hypothetical protein